MAAAGADAGHEGGGPPRTVTIRSSRWLIHGDVPCLAKSSLDQPNPTTDIPAASSMSMRIGRTILTFLVALSLAMAPGAGAFAMQKDEVTASNVVVASAHDCCDDEGMPADHVMKDCQASAGCATKCLTSMASCFHPQ